MRIAVNIALRETEGSRMATLRWWVTMMSRIGVLLMLAACAAGPGVFTSEGSGPAVEAPAYRVGDRWVYHGSEGFRVKTEWEETHEVTAIGPEGITVRITQRGPAPMDATRTEVFTAPGQMKIGAAYVNETRRFSVPLQLYNFPLAAGQVWNQWVGTYNDMTRENGELNRYVRVAGWDKVSTPAGSFDALRLEVLMRLDDETFWRYATMCNYAVWYAPAAHGVVREDLRAQYAEKDGGLEGGAAVRTQHGVLQLVSFTAGR
jgi:hypothetical protein